MKTREELIKEARLREQERQSKVIQDNKDKREKEEKAKRMQARVFEKMGMRIKVSKP